MAETVASLLDQICGIARRYADPVRTKRARQRHADMFAWRESDYIPLAFARPVPELAAFPDFDWRQQFFDPSASLYQQLKDAVIPQLASRSDATPGVRADTGVVNCMSVFGAEYDVPTHTRPVINRYVDRDAIAAFEVPDDISQLGTMPRVIEHMRHHVEALRERGLSEVVSVYHCDQQGPWDIAAQTRGHDIFLEVYEDGDFVHGLMEKATSVYIAVSKICKSVNGEPLNAGNTVGVWSESGGVRMCGDSDILVRAQTYREFIQPYEERAFAAFGGGWLHYCGGWPGFKRAEGLHLHDDYSKVEGLRGLNWTTAGDWFAEMARLRDLGIVHVGGIYREEGESMESLFRRMLAPYDRRAGIIPSFFFLDAPDADMAMDLWHKLQDERLPRAG